MKLSLEELQKQGEAPDWLTTEGLTTLKQGYLLPKETPKQSYIRIAKAAAKRLNKPELEQIFFDLVWKNWLCLATPVAANMGTDRGFPISCFSSSTKDSVPGIMDTMFETAMLSKHGGGVGTYWGDVRPRGSVISGNGKSDGIIPFLKILDSTTLGISQGGTRRGASVAYLPIEHGDFSEFIKMRRPSGDLNRQCQSIHHAATITDDFMDSLSKGNKPNREKWQEVLKTRFETGEPYLFFYDNVQRQRPECYVKNKLNIKASNLCNEIYLHSDEDHTFVCCLSSMNLTRWNEWKDTKAVYYAIWFLDAVMQEFIEKTDGVPGFEKARRFALKSRALGLGVLGFHSLIQMNGWDIEEFRTYNLNNQIFKYLQSEALLASQDLAKEYGEPEWCQGFGIRNTHQIAVAPTASNSLISGNVSPGIEPWTGNAFTHKTAKGTFIQKNKQLALLLQSKNKDIDDTWKSIMIEDGSVQHLDFLSEEEKAVFKTAREINQFSIVKLAAARQKFIDQGQSLNLFFPVNADPKYIHEVHMEAWKSGLKGLYYCRTGSVLKGDAGSREYKREVTECVMCEG